MGNTQVGPDQPLWDAVNINAKTIDEGAETSSGKWAAMDCDIEMNSLEDLA